MTSNHYDPVTRDQWVCSICRRPLDTYQRTDRDGTIVEFRFQHTVQDMLVEDHEPVPVRLEDSGGEIVGTCDFCSIPHPTWRYPCHDFGVPPYGSVGDWAACDDCHALIERANWSRLSARAVAKYPSGVRRELRPKVEGLHRKFAHHRCGDAVPLH